MYVQSRVEYDGQQSRNVQVNYMYGHTEWFRQTKCSWKWYMYLQYGKTSSSAMLKYCSLVS